MGKRVNKVLPKCLALSLVNCINLIKLYNFSVSLSVKWEQ